jgi:tetratricopeptide (TPR) repeat protein
MRPACVHWAAALTCIIGGCATPLPPPEAPAAPPVAAPSPPSPSLEDKAEQVLRKRAEGYMQQGRWADALVQWELLALLRPQAHEYHEQRDQVQRRIDAIAANSLALGDQARRSGNLDRATLEYLRVLSVDRNNARAAQALREIERERARRNYFNRPPRYVL